MKAIMEVRVAGDLRRREACSRWRWFSFSKVIFTSPLVNFIPFPHCDILATNRRNEEIFWGTTYVVNQFV